MIEFREGNAFKLAMYAAPKTCDGYDLTYSLENKTVRMVLRDPSGAETEVEPVVEPSDDTSRSAWMATYSVPVGFTTGKRGRWEGILAVAEDGLDFGVMEFKVVSRWSKTEGTC